MAERKSGGYTRSRRSRLQRSRHARWVVYWRFELAAGLTLVGLAGLVYLLTFLL